MFEGAKAPHELHFVDVPDDLAAGTAWTSDAEFDAITKVFDPPSADEGATSSETCASSPSDDDSPAGG